MRVCEKESEEGEREGRALGVWRGECMGGGPSDQL